MNNNQILQKYINLAQEEELSKEEGQRKELLVKLTEYFKNQLLFDVTSKLLELKIRDTEYYLEYSPQEECFYVFVKIPEEMYCYSVHITSLETLGAGILEINKRMGEYLKHNLKKYE